MSDPDLIQPLLDTKDPEDPGDPSQEAKDPRPFAVPIERPRSGVRARMLRRPMLQSALATAVPAWKLTALVFAVVVALVFFGPVPAVLVVAVLLLGELILRIVRRARVKACLGQTSSLPPPNPHT